MAQWTSTVRWLSGLIFVFAGIAKFAFHVGEVHAFTRYGLPSPSAFVDLIGVVEIVGGALLMLDRLVRPTALVLAVVMVAAIFLSGFGHGEVVPSLTLAPLLLAAMLFLLWVDPVVDADEPARPTWLRRRPAPR
jgi:uncharacterized membrane protein YphA (DoxX/SURF4 family)